MYTRFFFSGAEVRMKESWGKKRQFKVRSEFHSEKGCHEDFIGDPRFGSDLQKQELHNEKTSRSWALIHEADHRVGRWRCRWPNLRRALRTRGLDVLGEFGQTLFLLFLDTDVFVNRQASRDGKAGWQKQHILKYMEKALERRMCIDQGSITSLNFHNQRGTVEI